MPRPACRSTCRRAASRCRATRSTGVEGEAHAQNFTVSCEVAALRLRTQGSGSSRRRAEQEAAEHMLESIATREGTGTRQ